MPCTFPERDLLTFWVAGSLDAEAAARVAAHVSGCVDCQADAAAAADVIDGLRSLHASADAIVAAASGDAVPPDVRAHLDACARCRDEVALLQTVTADLASQPSRRGLRREWVLGLAAAAAIVIAVPLLRHRLGPEAARPPASVDTGSSSVAPAAAAARIRIEKPSLTALADESIAVRSGDSARRALLRDLATALEPYRRDDVAESAVRLRALAASRPDAAEIPYYLGICLLLLDRPAEAIAPLAQADRLAPSPDARYYLAVAQVNAGQTQAGTDALRSLCGGRAPATSRACAALAQLPGGSRR